MKKYLVAIPVLGVVGLVIGLGISDKVVWSWENSTRGNNINYCMLIGQLDHNDSGARTKGIRDKLGTRVPTNPGLPNVEPAKQGKLDITITKNDEPIKLQYKVNELHAKECKSDAGVTWDQATAALTATSWYSRYRENLTMIISNNDGMAEGALLTRNAIKGMPIFGYDSNSSTLDKIQTEHSIKGTINSNAPAQAFAIYNTVARVLDNVGKGTGGITPDDSKDDWKNYIFSGMNVNGVEYENDSNNKNPYLEENKQVADFLSHDIKFTYDVETKALKVNSIMVNEDNVKDYNVPAKNQIVKNLASGSSTKRTILQCAYSATDNYLTSTLVPIFEGTVPSFGLDYGNIVSGDGNDESDLINKVKMPAKAAAYVLNIVKTVDANMFLKAIYEKCKGGDDEFANTPIIFYNRQPTKQDGSTDTDVMKGYFDGKDWHLNPYIYYVGFDADEGGELQGDLVIDWLEKEFAQQYEVDPINVEIEAVKDE